MSSEKSALLLGGNKLNRGIYDKFGSYGYQTVVIDWNANPAIIGDLHLQVDVKDASAIINKLLENGIFSIVGAYTSTDVAVPTITRINQHFGLLGTTLSSAFGCMSKEWMKNAWEEAGLLNRRHITINRFDSELRTMFSKCRIVVKPDSSSSSNGLTVLDEGFSEKDLYCAYNYALQYSNNGRVAIEDYIEGTEYTAEMLADHKGNIRVFAISKKYHTKNAGSNRIATKLHYNPADVERDLLESIAEFAIACMRALKLYNCFGHLELMVKSDGTFTPIEIGARSSGFICSHLANAASGEDYLGTYLKVIEGAYIEPGYTQNCDQSSMYFFYDIPTGSTIHNSATLKDFLPETITSLYSDTDEIYSGRVVEQIQSDNHRLGYEILIGSRQNLTIETITKTEQNFLNYINNPILDTKAQGEANASVNACS